MAIMATPGTRRTRIRASSYSGTPVILLEQGGRERPMKALVLLFSIGLSILSVIVGIGNYQLLIEYILHRKKSSKVLLVGSMCGEASLALYSFELLRRLWWAPLLIHWYDMLIPFYIIRAVIESTRSKK